MKNIPLYLTPILITSFFTTHSSFSQDPGNSNAEEPTPFSAAGSSGTQGYLLVPGYFIPTGPTGSSGIFMPTGPTGYPIALGPIEISQLNLEEPTGTSSLIRYSLGPVEYTESNPLDLDYSHSRVYSRPAPSAKPIQEVQKEIEKELEFYKSGSIKLFLKGNFLEDEGTKSLVDFILGNQILQDNLRFLDLSNNRITKNSLGGLKSLLEKCPNLHLKLSINYISFSELREVFRSDFSDRITFSVA